MKNPERFYQEGKEKPPVVYHASQNPDIEEFTPQQGRVRDPDEGPVIFATPDKALASAFLVENHNDDWMVIGFYSDVPVVVIRADREKFILKDKGGTIYNLPATSFDFDLNKGMGEREWTSRFPVKPIGKKKCSSALDEMVSNGVQVYFVTQSEFKAIKEAEDYGLGILKGLKSENQRRQRNISELPSW